MTAGLSEIRPRARNEPRSAGRRALIKSHPHRRRSRPRPQQASNPAAHLCIASTGRDRPHLPRLGTPTTDSAGVRFDNLHPSGDTHRCVFTCCGKLLHDLQLEIADGGRVTSSTRPGKVAGMIGKTEKARRTTLLIARVDRPLTSHWGRRAVPDCPLFRRNSSVADCR